MGPLGSSESVGRALRDCQRAIDIFDLQHLSHELTLPITLQFPEVAGALCFGIALALLKMASGRGYTRRAATGQKQNHPGEPSDD